MVAHTDTVAVSSIPVATVAARRCGLNNRFNLFILSFYLSFEMSESLRALLV